MAPASAIASYSTVVYFQGSTSIITQCHNKFTHNIANYGGAVASANSIDTFSGNHFINNTALTTGGATSIQVGNLNISGMQI